MIYLILFLTFLKIGAFTFGGGYAMLPLIQEAVFKHNWVAENDFVNFIAISESTPGPFAINIATYIGSKVGGIFGSFCATFGVVLPSFVIILIVASFYEKYKNSKAINGIMTGLKPAVVGLIGAAALSVFATVFLPDGFSAAVFKDFAIYISAGIFILSLILALKKVHPIIIICISAVIGIGVGYLI